MATSNEFEHRRRERRRRERLRKKRIRAAILLIAFICLIVLICVAVSMCKHKDTNTVSLPQEGEQLEETLAPGAAIPTVPPVSASSNIPPASQENDLMQIIRDSGESKYCYLTFDDGPTENITPQILDVLRRYNVKATFFQIGSLIKSNPDMARRVYEEGHLLANHSDGHNYAKLYVSTDTFMNEVNDCYEAIKDVTGEAEPFKLVRFPGGSFNSSADSYSPVKQQCKAVMAEYGFYQCNWNALNGDAEGRTKNAEELLDYMISNLDGEENVVVLMHDAAAKQATADALPSIIEYFIREGYTFHRLDDIDYHGAVSSLTTATPTASSDDEGSDDEDEDAPSATAAAQTPTATQSVQTAAPAATTPAASSGTSTNSNVIIIQ